MKARVKGGYEAEFSDHVRGYDDHGLAIQTKVAANQLEGLDLTGLEVLDVGCGTGVVSFAALERGAAHVTAGDVSALMLERTREKAGAYGIAADHITFAQLDADALPFADGSFDVVLSSLILGLLPDPQQAIAEMARVLRPGGLLLAGAHGREYFWEAVDAMLRSIDKRYVLGYRMEFWPRAEHEWLPLFDGVGLDGVSTRRVCWKNQFASGGEAYDFATAIASCWWYERFPPAAREADSRRMRAYFERKGIKEITDDIVVVSGRKA
jgi:ubiquinone/menaquinone biosynthesis C-methylase UbiE